MTEKVRKLSVFIQALSRIPGLSFLAETERDLRETVDQVDDMGDSVEEGRRQITDVRRAATDIASSEDED